MQPRKDYRQVPSFNLIPLEYQRRTISFRRLWPRLLIVLAIAGEGLFIQNLYQEKFPIETAIASIEQRIQQIEGEKSAVASAKEKEVKELEAAIASIQQRIQQIGEEKLTVASAREEEAGELAAKVAALKKGRQILEDDWRTLAAKRADWTQVMTALFQSKPEGVELSSVVQNGARVDVIGTASDYAKLLQHRNLLLASPAISQIISLKSDGSEPAISFFLALEAKMGGQ